MEDKGKMEDKDKKKNVKKIIVYAVLLVLIILDSRINMTRLVPQLRVLHKSQPA